VKTGLKHDRFIEDVNDDILVIVRRALDFICAQVFILSGTCKGGEWACQFIERIQAVETRLGRLRRFDEAIARPLAPVQLSMPLRGPCIRLARGKFELTNQDSGGGKNSSVLM